MPIYINKKLFESDEDNFQEVSLKELFDEEAYNTIHTGKIERLDGRVYGLCKFIEMFLESNLIGRDFLKHYCENSSYGNSIQYKYEEDNAKY